MWFRVTTGNNLSPEARDGHPSRSSWEYPTEAGLCQLPDPMDEINNLRMAPSQEKRQHVLLVSLSK